MVNFEKLFVMKLKILLILIFLISSIGYCCSCIDLTGKPVLEHINWTEQIFEGTIINIDFGNEIDITAEFVITRKIKGVDSLDKIKIKTSKSGPMCGIYFKKGQKWLVFSNSNRTGLCDGNIELGNNTLKEFSDSKAPYQHKFYYSKLIGFLNKISELITFTQLVEYDKERNIIAKGEIGQDKQPIGKWLYKDVATEEIIIEVKN